MTRLIDANKLKMYIDTCECCEKCPDIAFMCQESCEFPDYLTSQWERAIDEQPTVDAVPVRHGKWLWLDGVRCSQCNYKLATTGLPSYCPNCGAKMDERKEE